MKIFLTIIAMLAGSILYGQDKIKIMLMGTFHFAQTDTNVFDIRSDKRQNELSELMQHLTRFAPDKIFIEQNPEFEYVNRRDSLYQEYLKERFTLRMNEIYQVGFRLGKILGHKKIYQCDHPGRYGMFYEMIDTFAKMHGQLDILRSRAAGTTMPLTSIVNEDSLMKTSTMMQYLKWLNSKEVQRSSHAHYINTFPRLGSVNVSPEVYDSTYFLGTQLVADWYRRNLMTYSKILNQIDHREKKIFVIIGNDHVPILRHLFESNPYFVIEEF